MHIRNESENHRMLVNMILACNQFRFFQKKKKKRNDELDREQDVEIQTSTLRLNEEQVIALAHHRPQIGAVDEHVLHVNSRFVQWVTIDSAAIRRFMPWGDHVLPESNKTDENTPELVVIAFEEVRFQKDSGCWSSLQNKNSM